MPWGMRGGLQAQPPCRRPPGPLRRRRSRRRCPFGRLGEGCEIDFLAPCRQFPDTLREWLTSSMLPGCCWRACGRVCDRGWEWLLQPPPVPPLRVLVCASTRVVAPAHYRAPRRTLPLQRTAALAPPRAASACSAAATTSAAGTARATKHARALGRALTAAATSARGVAARRAGTPVPGGDGLRSAAQLACSCIALPPLLVVPPGPASSPAAHSTHASQKRARRVSRTEHG